MPAFCPRCGTLMMKVGGRMKSRKCSYVEGEREPEKVEKASYGDGLFPF